VKRKSEFPGDPEGGMFGLRPAIEQGSPPRAPGERNEAHERLVAALMARLRKRRGRRPANWRSDLRPVVAYVLKYSPKATNAEIAREIHTCLKEADGKKPWPLVSLRTLQNWLTEVRKLVV
jgi:cytochrome P450